MEDQSDKQERIVGALKRARRSSYKSALEPEISYMQTRGIKEYNHELPEFQGKKVSEIIAERARKGEIDVLDVGAGAAVFLGELKRAWPNIRTYAASAVDVRHDRELQREIPRHLLKYIDQVDYRSGDIQRLTTLFPKEKFDVITSVMAFLYLGDPLNEIRQIYRLLKPGGIAFIDFPKITTTKEEDKTLLEFWKKFGVNAELSLAEKGNDDGCRHKNLVLEKDAEVKLPMPFSLHAYGGWMLDRNKMKVTENDI